MDKVATKNKDVSARKAEETPEVGSGPVWKTESHRVHGAMWKHSQKNGARFTTSISRSYRDEKDKWVNTHFYDSQDLADVIIVANAARDEIYRRESLAKEAVEEPAA